MATCSYILKKGKNKGQACGIKCLINKQLCKKHLVGDDSNTLTSSSEQQPDIYQEKTQEIMEEPKESKPKQPKQKESKTKQPKQKESKKENELKETSIKVQIYDKIKPIAKRNLYGNYVLENNLVVHPINKKIIGRQKEEQIVNISIEDIDYCKENGFLYEQPSVLYFLNPEFEKRENELTKNLIKNKNNEEKEDNEILDEESDSENEDSENDL